MVMLYDDDDERIKLLYEFARSAYQSSSSWVSVKTFVPMFDKKPKEEFVPAPLINNKHKFIPTEIKLIAGRT
jgi:hypothetical protein